jgi:hypothetical protein
MLITSGIDHSFFNLQNLRFLREKKSSVFSCGVLSLSKHQP